MSVVVANRSDAPADVERAVSSLWRELLDGDEVIWVDGAGLSPQLPAVRRVRAGGAHGRGRMYGLGLQQATHDLVAFTDSVTELGTGWRTAAGEALAAGARVVGGPVIPTRADPVSTAGFLVEYGAHAVAPYTSATGDVAANNVAYQRSALARVVAPGAPVWKHAVNHGLAALGWHPVAAPGMVVASTKRYGWRDLGPVRAAHGRLYAQQRSVSWSARRRVAATLACAGLPVLALARLASTVRDHPELRRSFTRSVPLVALALTAWSAGEAWGYVAGGGGGNDVF